MSNTNSSRSFMNRLKRNPAAAFGILIAIVGIAALVWFFVFRGKKVQTGPGAAAGGEPVLEFELTGIKKVSKVNTTSEYAMRGYEYAAPYLGDNVDFVVTLKTKSGWDEADVTKVRIYRRKTPADGITAVDLIGTTEKPYKERDGITNFGSFDINLFGSELKANAVGPGGGSNTLILVPIKSDDSVFGTDNDVVNKGIATTTIDISDGDLNYKLEGVKSTDINWNISVPTSATDSSFFAGPGTSTKNRYKIVELAGDNEVSLEPGSRNSGGSVETWKFKVHPIGGDTYYITARAPLTTAGGSTDPVTQFKLSKVSATTDDRRYRILSGGKLLTWEGNRPNGDSSDSFQLIRQLSLTETQADNTVVTITPAATTPPPESDPNTPVDPSAATSPTYTIPNPGQGRDGGDLQVFDNTELADCKVSCNTTAGCAGIGYNISTKDCFLKDDTAGAYYPTEYVYYKKSGSPSITMGSPGVAFGGGSFTMTTNDLAGCKALCLSQDDCIGFNHGLTDMCNIATSVDEPSVHNSNEFQWYAKQ